MSEMTIEDPQVETRDRAKELDREIGQITAPANRQAVMASFGLAEVPQFKGWDGQERTLQARQDMKHWAGDRAALLGFATQMLDGVEKPKFSSRERAINAAMETPENQVAMKDPERYFRLVMGGLANFATKFHRTKAREHYEEFAFGRMPDSGAYASLGTIKYVRDANEELPEAFSIPMNLGTRSDYLVELTYSTQSGLRAEKRAGTKRKLATEEETIAYAQAAATMMYQAVCNYNPQHDRPPAPDDPYLGQRYKPGEAVSHVRWA